MIIVVGVQFITFVSTTLIKEETFSNFTIEQNAHHHHYHL